MVENFSLFQPDIFYMVFRFTIALYKPSPYLNYSFREVSKKQYSGYSPDIGKDYGFQKAKTKIHNSEGECHGKFKAAE